MEFCAHLSPYDEFLLQARCPERESSHVGAADPGWIELCAERHNDQDWNPVNIFDGPAERLQARRIDPMHVFKYHEHWLFFCQRLEPRRERFERSSPALLWG